MSTIKVDTVRPVTTDGNLTLQGDSSGAGVTGAKVFGDGSLGAGSITDLAGTGAPDFPYLPIGMIQGFDQYKLSADVTSDGTITSWSQLTSVPHGVKGSIGSFSSGIYTFAETGYYFVSGFFTFYAAINDTIAVYVKDDNTGSTQETLCRVQSNVVSSYRLNVGFSVIFNCNNTSVNKLLFEAVSLATGSTIATSPDGFSKINIMKIG